MIIHVVGNIFTIRHALKNEANVILLFGDSVLGQEEHINRGTPRN